MATSKTGTRKDKTDSASSDASSTEKKKPQGDGMRETVESIAIAFILAFLFRTFQAEMYVIPTGSMAPTLYGRHKEIQCPGCQFKYVLGASSEIDQETGLLRDRIEAAVCPNCRRANDVLTAPAFNGDRILVNKLVSKFERYDVVVFKNPEEGHVNYIKRLVGLPGETVRIRSGNVWARSNGGEAAQWEIQRKQDLSVQKAIQLTVYDDRHAPHHLLEAGWPERWVPSQYDEQARSVGGWPETENVWQADRTQRTYTAQSSGDGQLHWLRYRHVVPTQSDWLNVEINGEIGNAVEASLVSDFCGVNAECSGPFQNYDDSISISDYSDDAFWVGDLTINLTLQVDSADPDGTVTLELVEGLGKYRLQFDLSSGTVNLLRQSLTSRATDDFQPWATADCGVLANDSYDITFANVDDQICLWVDGELVEFDNPTTYDEPTPDAPLATTADLAPCGIAVQNADVVVSDLHLQRDIYYRNDTIRFTSAAVYSQDRPDFGLGIPRNSNETGDPYQPMSSDDNLHLLLRSPEKWSEKYRQLTAEQDALCGDALEFRLEDDEYLMFGDNSPRSKDSRLFDYEKRPLVGIYSHRHAVREQDLIGKALYICWPHGVPFLNDGEGFAVWNHKSRQGMVPDYPSFRLPFYPNFARMKKIR
jgi:signal peptidase I